MLLYLNSNRFPFLPSILTVCNVVSTVMNSEDKDEKNTHCYPEKRIHNLAVDVWKHLLRLPSSQTPTVLFLINIHCHLWGSLDLYLWFFLHMLTIILGSKDRLKFNLRKTVLETVPLYPALFDISFGYLLNFFETLTTLNIIRHYLQKSFYKLWSTN